jgi:hypothetical protein
MLEPLVMAGVCESVPGIAAPESAAELSPVFKNEVVVVVAVVVAAPT